MASLFDAFTGDPLKAAAESSRKYLGTAQENLINATGVSSGAARNILKDAYGNARTDLGTGYDAATGAINTGAGGALGYLDTGAAGATGALTANGGAYAPLSDLAQRFGQGSQLYANALGINGPQGNQAATQAFQAGPGYQWMVDQGIDAINRKRNAAGSLVGGNADRDAQLFGMNAANQEYGSWLDRLGGYNNLELGATQGAAAGNAGINQGVANILNQQGVNKAGVATGQGGSLADLARAFYSGQAGLDTAEGGALASNITDANKTGIGIGLNIAPQITKTYQQEGEADMAGSANQLKLGMELAKLAAGAAGGMGGGGGSFLPSSSFMNNSWGW